MITEKDIRAKFHKSNLRKVARALLAETHNGAPRYTLRPGVTADTIIESVRFGGIVCKKDSPFASALGQIKRPGFGWDNDALVHLRTREDGGFDIIRFPNSKTDSEKLDLWIRSMMSRSCFVSDSTAIAIY